MTPDLDRAHLTAARAVFALEALITTFGIVTNSVLFMATYRSCAVKSKCNFLIGVCALFNSIHLLGNFVGLTIMFKDGKINSFICSTLLFIPEICVYAGCFCMLSIGIDRLISATSAVFYRNVNRRKYLVTHLVAILLFSSYAPFLMIQYYSPERLICSISAPFHGEGKVLWIQAMLIIDGLALVPYVLTWRRLRTRDYSSNTKRVFRAIGLVMTFEVSGWLLAVALTTIIYTFDTSEANRIVTQYFCGCIVHFVIAIKPIIYYSKSSDYRSLVTVPRSPHIKSK